MPAAPGNEIDARLGAVALADRAALAALHARIRRRAARGQATSLLEQRLQVQLAAAERLIEQRRATRWSTRKACRSRRRAAKSSTRCEPIA
jgi:hypothetical protein